MPRKPGSKNRKTEEWEVFSNYCLEGGLKRFQSELNKLEGTEFTNAFLRVLEFHKPKIRNTDPVGAGGDVNILLVQYGNNTPLQVSTTKLPASVIESA